MRSREVTPRAWEKNERKGLGVSVNIGAARRRRVVAAVKIGGACSRITVKERFICISLVNHPTPCLPLLTNPIRPLRFRIYLHGS